MFTGLRSIIYPSTNLEADTAFWVSITGKEPYFKEAYYVGFDIDGCELGLDPNAASEGLSYPITYWLVENTTEATDAILSAGATTHTEPKDVGGGLTMATFKDKTGNIFGVIEHPKKN